MQNRIRARLARVPLLRRLKARLGPAFPGSARYWERRYRRGGTSGAGSEGRLAQFKAAFINDFVRANEVASVIELGCGDGTQLALARYPRYVGLDVSAEAVRLCGERFRGDEAKSFFHYDPAAFFDGARVFAAELALSLDVIYHLVEDAVYERYLNILFGAATRYVIVYSSDREGATPHPHIRHRAFTRDVAQRFPEWTLAARREQQYPLDRHGEAEGSFADFFVFRKA
jgi:SAM-dependent methyltransferase